MCGAFDLYQADQDMEELQDTLLRCAKLEARKRLNDKQSKVSNDAIYKYDEIEGKAMLFCPIICHIPMH